MLALRALVLFDATGSTGRENWYGTLSSYPKSSANRHEVQYVQYVLRLREESVSATLDKCKTWSRISSIANVDSLNGEYCQLSVYW